MKNRQKNHREERKPRTAQVHAEGTRPMLHRICFIDRQIASEKYPNTRTLAKDYESSTATISRDIDFLRNMFGAPIEYDFHHKGYYYTDKSYRLPFGFSRAGNVLALALVRNLVSLCRDTPVYGEVRELLDAMNAPLSEEERACCENRIVVPQVPSAPVPETLWNTITVAIQKNQILAFEYQGAWDEEYRLRRVRPYQLLFDNGVWLLYAWVEDRQAERIFSLPRIRNAVITADRFTLPEDYDYRAKTGGSYFGVFAGQQNYHFRIAFYDEAIVHVQERQWAEDQRIEEAGTGIIIDFTGAQFGKVFEWVLSQGCNALPLEPPELVEAWRDNARKTAEIAGKR
jgi:predicted DNA-binding transcriptional regulator YafY